jgi:hypothetical protein
MKFSVESPIDFDKTGIFAVGVGFSMSPYKVGTEAFVIAKTYDYFASKWSWAAMSLAAEQTISYIIENPLSSYRSTNFDKKGFWTKAAFKQDGKYKMKFQAIRDFDQVGTDRDFLLG